MGTDVVGGSGTGGIAGGALPGTWNVVTGIKPETPSIARQDHIVPAAKPEVVA